MGCGIKCCWIAALFLFLPALIPFPANAQTGGSTLQGAIVGAGGKPIAGAQIRIRNLGTASVCITTSDERGLFSSPQLPSGNYLVVVSHPGLITLHIAVKLAVAQTRSLGISMTSGSPEETQTVVAGEENVQATPSAGGVADSRTVSELPSNGRDWTQAATLQAGVSSVKTQPDAGNIGSGRGQRGFGAQISVSGGRPQQNNYMLDGISINDYANSAPGSVLGLDLGADAVEQFSVVSSNYPAGWGRSSGGIINAVTRSGTNEFHGSVYEFLRNSALDTRNYFDSIKPPFRRNQFGVAIGAPLHKNSTFLFANYEGLRQSLGITNINTVPSPAARTGTLSTGDVQLDPASARYLAFYPLPNRGLLAPGDVGIFAFSGQQITPENYFTGRIDQAFQHSDNLSGTYVFDDAQTTQPDTLNIRLNEIQTRRNLLSIQERHSFSQHAVNAFRFGLNRVVARLGLTPKALNPLAADTSYGFLPGFTSGILNTVGITSFAGGLNAASTYSFHWTSIQAYDDFNITRGMYDLHFGVAMERMRDNMLGITNPNGSFNFNSLSDFLTNRPFSLSISLPDKRGPRDLRQTLFSGYLQDDMHVSTRLTLNLGARYEATTVPTEVNGKLSTLRNLSDTAPHLGNPYFYNPTRMNFEPRVGVAWDMFGTGRVMVRSGYGIFDVLPLPYEFELLSLFAAPFFENVTPSSLPAGSFPTEAITIASNNGIYRNVYIQPHPARNYINQWNLNLAWEISRKSSLLIGYVGSRGIHQTVRVDDTNIVLPTRTPQGYLWPGAASGTPKINPASGRLDGMFWNGRSYYDALQVQANADLSHGLQIDTSYTWGKSIDTGSSTIAGDQFANSISSLPWFDLRLARGLSDFNVAQTFSTHFTYELPSRQHSSMWYLQHWRLNGTYQATTGAPFTPVVAGDPLGEGSTDPYDVPNRLHTAGCGHPIHRANANGYLNLQCFAFPFPSTLLGDLGRNSVIGPGLSDLDMSVFKDSFIKRISNSLNVQLRVEIFNLLNRANFSPPLDHRAIFDQNGNIIPGAGLIDSTATPSRQMQVGLKVLW